MGLFSKRGQRRAPEPANAMGSDQSQVAAAIFGAVDEAIASADQLAVSTDRAIQDNFGRVASKWGCEDVLVLEQAAIRELLRRVTLDDRATGFDRLRVTSGEAVGANPLSYVQLNSVGDTFRPYRLVKCADGRLALYGHATLYLAKRDLDRADGTRPAPPLDDLITELITLGWARGALLDTRGSELRTRVESIGTALDKAGGRALMLEAHAAVRHNLGAVLARELEAAWDGVGTWQG